MTTENYHSKEIQSRIDSEMWSQKIARNVSNKYEHQQTRNKVLLSISTFLLIGLVTLLTYFTPNDFLNSNIAELDTYRLFLTDDFTPLYDTIYQEESITSLIEPISFFVK